MNDENPIFRPKRRLEITAEMVEAAREPEEDELDLTSTDTTHPLDRVDFREFIEKEFPEISNRINNAVRQQQSKDPDELESWELTRILKRKDRFENESNWAYLVRLLYEEMFSVNQAPNKDRPPMMMGTPGLTIGGLISHFYREDQLNGVSLDQIVRRNFSGKTMKEALQVIRQHLDDSESPMRVFNQFVDRVQYLSQRNDAPFLSAWRVLEPGFSTDKVIVGNSDRYKTTNPELDSVGYRLLAILKKEPKFLEEVEDTELKQLINIPPEQSVNRAMYFVRAWHFFQKVFSLIGNQNIEQNTELRKLVEKMLIIRMHPEMGIFFKYFSPSGYLNS